jgi:hypothetical protein
VARKPFTWLFVLGAVVCLGPGTVAGPPLATQPKGLLDQLQADYVGYGFALPPPGTKLVRFVSPFCEPSIKKEYCLGFLLKPGSRKDGPLVLAGIQKIQNLGDAAVKVIESEFRTEKEIQSCLRGITFDCFLDPEDEALLLGVQCHARGWDKLADELVRRSRRPAGGKRGVSLSPRVILAQRAWQQAQMELIKPGNDRGPLARHMRAALKAAPALDNQANRDLLRCLELALVPSRVKPGTVEALIDDLVDLSSYKDGLFNWGTTYDKEDPRYSRLLLLGFDAAPALIEHLDDERLTRSQSLWINNFFPWNLRVQHVVSDLLQDLSGRELGPDNVRRLQGYTVDKDDARRWWQGARKVGEEQYLGAHVLPAAADAKWPHDGVLRILTRKYPRNLPKLYKTVLAERPKMYIWPLTKAIGKSTLPREEKLELILLAAISKDLENRHAAFWELKDLDHACFVRLLVETLDALPPTPKEPYWKCREATFATLVLETIDIRAWKALERAARRADAGLRMELLAPLAYNDVPKKQHRLRLALLASFLDDITIRDAAKNPAMYRGPYAKANFPILEVRNFAAWDIMLILGKDVEPKPDWTDDEWARIRVQCRQALKTDNAKP